MTPEDAPSDPLQMWREWSASMSETMAHPESGETSARIAKALSDQQTLVQEATRQYFKAANIPSREDVMAIAERLGGIESRLEAIELLLTRLADAASKRKKKRRKQPKRGKKQKKSQDG